MCGIWGFVSTEVDDAHKIKVLLRKLSVLSESRGKEAAGVALLTANEVRVLKQALPASKFVNSLAYKEFIDTNLFKDNEKLVCAIGHSRLVTNGSAANNDNNQPVSKPGLTTVHNGIIVNVNSILEKYSDLDRCEEVDTEVFVELVLKHLQENGGGIKEAFQTVYGEIYGTASTLNILPAEERLVAASNNGSLYLCLSSSAKSVVFASESLTLERLIKSNSLGKELFNIKDIVQITCANTFSFDLKTLQYDVFKVPTGDVAKTEAVVIPYRFQVDLNHYRKFEIDERPIRELRRCTKCVLPETMPFIEFDDHGVCNYCKTYKHHSVKGEASLREWADRQRGKGKQADSIISFSGGRDSSYGLHVFVRELGLHPVAYSYDWGMVTDLARRNQSRMCASLGVELITISADIKKKRDNIQRNIKAWLKKPDLGLVPLFMAGDKQYFYYANQVRKNYGLETVLMASNPFEKTHFKSGFCGVKPAILNTNDGMELEQLRLGDVFKMAAHYTGQYLSNPSYINRSLMDTVGATISYYAIPHNYFRLFNYIPWDESTVDNVLLNEYAWEKSFDSESTWRIGDGTAPFYNYIYYLIAGFSENDTLRSNQIREGMLSREDALDLVYRDNRPRFDSMQWYFDVIGLDMETVLKRVNEIPRLYQK